MSHLKCFILYHYLNYNLSIYHSKSYNARHTVFETLHRKKGSSSKKTLRKGNQPEPGFRTYGINKKLCIFKRVKSLFWIELSNISYVIFFSF